MPIENALSAVEIAAVQQRLMALTSKEGSQAAVARLLGVSQQAVSKALKGQVGFTLARRVATHLEVSFEDLVGRQGAAPVLGIVGGDRPTRRDLTALPTSELIELLNDLAVRQLRDIIDRSNFTTTHSVDLADAAIVLVSRLRRPASGPDAAHNKSS